MWRRSMRTKTLMGAKVLWCSDTGKNNNEDNAEQRGIKLASWVLSQTSEDACPDVPAAKKYGTP